MKKFFLITGLAAALFSAGAQADPITFFDVQYEATTVALTADGPAGFSTQSGALGPDLVALQADSVGATDIATAGALVGLGALTTSADVSAVGIGSAVSTAHFIGSFANGGSVNLALDFSMFDIASGSGSASTTLFVSLISDGVTLFADYVTEAWMFSYGSLAGTTSVLDLTLTSEVSAAFLSAAPGNASSFGTVSITGTVPEAPTWLLCLLGLSLLAAPRASRIRANPR